jgi:hypothetical protein|tara:strand:- start:15 stop:488 length:474 start_codon:yes stop_codon:yes gene_type:complete
MKKQAMRVCDRQNLVAEIVEGVVANNLKIVTTAINKHKDYKLAQAKHKRIKKLYEKRQALNDELGKEEREMTEIVRTINDSLPIQFGEKDYGGKANLSYVPYDNYNGGSFSIDSEIPYNLREKIERKVALETMSSYCFDNIQSIIESLTKEFSGGKK